MWPFHRKKKQDQKEYLRKLIQKAYPLAQLWVSRIKTTKDPKKADRILNHLHRIYRVQLKAKIKLEGM